MTESFGTVSSNWRWISGTNSACASAACASAAGLPDDVGQGNRLRTLRDDQVDGRRRGRGSSRSSGADPSRSRPGRRRCASRIGRAAPTGSPVFWAVCSVMPQQVRDRDGRAGLAGGSARTPPPRSRGSALRRARTGAMVRGRSTSAARVETGTGLALARPSSRALVLVEDRLGRLHHDLGRVRVGRRSRPGPTKRERARRRQDAGDVVERRGHRRRVRIAVVGVDLTRALDHRAERADLRRGAGSPSCVRSDSVPSGVSATSGTLPVTDSTSTRPSA